MHSHSSEEKSITQQSINSANVCTKALTKMSKENLLVHPSRCVHIRSPSRTWASPSKWTSQPGGIMGHIRGVSFWAWKNFWQSCCTGTTACCRGLLPCAWNWETGTQWYLKQQDLLLSDLVLQSALTLSFSHSAQLYTVVFKVRTTNQP